MLSIRKNGFKFFEKYLKFNRFETDIIINQKQLISKFIATFMSFERNLFCLHIPNNFLWKFAEFILQSAQS